MAVKDFIGRGWIFPLRFDPTSGGVAKDRGTGRDQKLNRIRMSLRQIIGVQRGEMFMQRRFGSGARDLIFALDTRNFKARLEVAVTRGITDKQFGEKRVFLEKMDVSLSRRTAVANILIDVVLRSSNVKGNLVLPFYLTDDLRPAVERTLGTGA